MNNVSKRGEIIPLDKRQLIAQRYRCVTRAINREFWGSESGTAHSLYVGSYGRGTAIDTSDIDILVELPRSEYERFDNYKGNGQSRLLQSVKNAIIQSYPRSDIRADGQVVCINFSDGIKFEILPAFRKSNWYGESIYEYPDANMGGNWLSTNPKAEQLAMEERNKETNGLLYDTCRHIRQIRDTQFSNHKLPGFFIDTFVYRYIGGWHWLRTDEKPSKDPRGTYESKLCEKATFLPYSLEAPGSRMSVETSQYVENLNRVLQYMADTE